MSELMDYNMTTEQMRFHAYSACELEAIGRGDGRIPIRHELLTQYANEFDTLRADLARLRELLGEALDRIPHWQRCAIFDNPEEQCDCERSDIQSRIQSELKE